MPHSVNTFLNAVHKKLWDGTVFVRNRPHVLVAHTAAPGSDRMSELRRAGGLDRLAFREHSEEYPHVRGTVGFAGRPGGPNFYVNKMDNTADHGRGPHQSRGDNGGDWAPSSDEHEGDPCFGKIVTAGGMELMDEMSALPVGDDIGTFVRPVVIRRAVVLTRGAGDDGEWREHGR